MLVIVVIVNFVNIIVMVLVWCDGGIIFVVMIVEIDMKMLCVNVESICFINKIINVGVNVVIKFLLMKRSIIFSINEWWFYFFVKIVNNGVLIVIFKVYKEIVKFVWERLIWKFLIIIGNKFILINFVELIVKVLIVNVKSVKFGEIFFFIFFFLKNIWILIKIIIY